MRKANHCISVWTLAHGDAVCNTSLWSLLRPFQRHTLSSHITQTFQHPHTDFWKIYVFVYHNLGLLCDPGGSPPWFTVFKGPITLLWAWAAYYKLSLTRTTVCLRVSINIISDLVWSKACQYSNFFKNSCWQWNILKNKYNLLSQLYLFPWKYILKGLFPSFSKFYLPVFHIFSDYSGSCIDCTRIQRLLQVCQMCTEPSRQLLGTSPGKKQYDAH